MNGRAKRCSPVENIVSEPTLSSVIKLAKLCWILPVHLKISHYGVVLQIFLRFQPSQSFNSYSYVSPIQNLALFLTLLQCICELSQECLLVLVTPDVRSCRSVVTGNLNAETLTSQHNSVSLVNEKLGSSADCPVPLNHSAWNFKKTKQGVSLIRGIRDASGWIPYFTRWVELSNSTYYFDWSEPELYFL